MEQIELVAGLKRLGIVYGKEYTKDECEIFYDFLRSYSVNTWVEAVNKYISVSKFPPKPVDLLELCDKVQSETKIQSQFEVLHFMKAMGYFKHSSEYDKAVTWLERNIVPEWFKEDLNKYYKMMKTEKLENKEVLMIG